MMKLKRVNNTNIIDITNLLLGDEQRRYMVSPLNFLETVKDDKNCRPLIIYNYDIPVGFFLWYYSRYFCNSRFYDRFVSSKERLREKGHANIDK